MKIRNGIYILFFLGMISILKLFPVELFLAGLNEQISQTIYSWTGHTAAGAAMEKTLDKCFSTPLEELDEKEFNLKFSFGNNYSERLRLQRYNLCLKRLNHETIYPQIKQRYSELAEMMYKDSFSPTFHGEKTGLVRHPRFDALFYAIGLYPTATVENLAQVDISSLCKNLESKSIAELIYSCLVFHSQNNSACYHYANQSSLIKTIENTIYCRRLATSEAGSR